ncbi:MAG: hypothetical protein HKN12_07365, partial [Gemmatimonadetes bacterium]|nr:hypothetical protein [Gemmatimonadota bacterium]
MKALFLALGVGLMMVLLAGCRSGDTTEPFAPATTAILLDDPLDTTEPVDATPVPGSGITPVLSQTDNAGLG